MLAPWLGTRPQPASRRAGTLFVVGSLLVHAVVAWAMPRNSGPGHLRPPNASTVAFSVAPRPEPPTQPAEPEQEPPPQVERAPEPRRTRPDPRPPRPARAPEPEPEPAPEEPQGSPRDLANETEASRSPEPADSADSRTEALQTVPSAQQGLAVARPEGDGSGHASEGAVAGEPSVEKGPQAGQDGPPGVDRSALKRDYLRRLMATLSRNRSYPRAATRARMEGVVLLSITIDPGGVIAGVRVARSSGHGLLDRAALQSVHGLERLPQPPAALAARRHTHELTVPLAYRLAD